MTETLHDRAYDLGYGAGKSVGSWVIDGNTTQAYAEWLLKGYADGDPEVMDIQPVALSGEFADSPTPQSIATELDVHPADEDAMDEICNGYEDGFDTGYWDQVVASAKKVVE